MSSYDSKKRNKKDEETRCKKPRRTTSDSDEWVEKETLTSSNRDEWMSMTGMLKTYTKQDDKRKPEKKQQLDSYNPSSSSRELNPYWKNGGTGIPQTSDEFRRSQMFKKPSQDDDFYTSSSRRDRDNRDRVREWSTRDDHYSKSSKYESERNYKSGNWRKSKKTDSNSQSESDHSFSKEMKSYTDNQSSSQPPDKTEKGAEAKSDSKYLSDEKLNKLAAKLVKAEIMGDTELINKLKTKLEEAREYRKQNPGAANEEEGIMLTTMNSMGNVRPLTKSSQGDPNSKGGKRRADTHATGERQKYFADDDKYNLSQMFEQEKYGTNHDEEAEFADIISKHKNPNDDLEDIFAEKISKNKNSAKDDERNRQRAIKQHSRIEKSMDGCEYCIDSKNMLKHLIIERGTKSYIALPSRKSLVPGHCQITTMHHVPCVTSLDEDVWEEIMDYRKALTSHFNSLGQDVVFFELATHLHKFPHMVINCVPLPRDVGDMASIYFKKALLECETEWSVNKKVIDLKGKNILKGVPKGLPYFWVDFGMDPGFAHVIEDQRMFPKMFAEEIIGGMLDLDHSLWKNPKREYNDQQRKKVLEFMEIWKSTRH